MSLFKNWVDSVAVFKPSNFKLLFLVTLNSLRRHYKFFVSAIILFALFDNNLWQVLFGVNIVFFNYIQTFLLLYMPFIFVLVVRPSIKRKDFECFWDYKWHFILWVFFAIINVLVFIGCSQILVYILCNVFNVFGMSAIFLFAVPVIILPVKIIETFFALFWLDSRLGFKTLFMSLWRAIKLFMFNYPVYLILFAIPYLCFFIFVNYCLYLFGSFWSIFITYFVLLAYIFYTCFLVNFYTKNIHDKFDLYFKE